MGVGICCCIATGLLWVSIGVGLARVQRGGGDAGLFNLAVAAILVVAALATAGVARLAGADAGGRLSLSSGLFPALCLFATGCLKYPGDFFAARGMASGPGGAVWSIGMSGLVFPFAMGATVFGNRLGAAQYAGLALILVSVALNGACKGGEASAVSKTASPEAAPYAWLPWALASFVAGGASQCLASLPSYWPETRASALGRMLFMQLGVVAAWCVHSTMRRSGRSRRIQDAHSWPRTPRRFPALEARCAAVTAFCCFVGGAFFQFEALDRLSDAGCGGIAYPIMIASCLAGFFLWTVLALHERPSRLQAAGLAAALAGIALTAMP